MSAILETHVGRLERELAAVAGELDVDGLNWDVVVALERTDPHVKAAIDHATQRDPETGCRVVDLDRAQIMFLVIATLAHAKAQALDRIAELRRDLIASRAQLAAAQGAQPERTS